MSNPWWAVMSSARWFAGKGRDGRLTAVIPLAWYTPVGELPAIRPEIAEVTYPDGSIELYQLLAGYQRPGDGSASELGLVEVAGLGEVALHDAARDPDLLGHLLGAWLAASTSGNGLDVVWVDTAGLSPRLPARVFSGEQSNTSIMFGDVAMAKLFRRLEPGRSLDVEVHAALAQAGSRAAAHLFGWQSGSWTTSTKTPWEADLGMVVAKLPEARDGWELALAACAAERSFAAEARALGAALAQVHEQLADAFGTQTLLGDTVADTMTRRFEAAREQASVLDGVDVEGAFAPVRGRELRGQRVHGDFHLGQTLSTADGWKIIDFEGEPMKSMAQRREFDSVWRDVAGMLRSFDYARSGHAQPGGAAALGWAKQARRAFLQGYGADPDAPASELAAYELDKAIYEVVYEVRNRPDWVHIPAGAVHDLTSTPAGPGGTRQEQ